VKAGSVKSRCEPYVQLLIEAAEGCKSSSTIVNHMSGDTKAWIVLPEVSDFGALNKPQAVFRGGWVVLPVC